MQQLFQRVVHAVRKALNPPTHIRLYAVGGSLDDCLRQLEDEAGLPEGDLSLRGDSSEVATIFGPRGLSHPIVSKTSEKWKGSSDKEGYIAGHVTLFAHDISPGNTCMGKLHISRNCPGVYRDNVCTTCGDECR
jgi:hypothetical protein